MLSSNLNPQFISHGHPGKHNEKIYVIELFFSSTMIERHVFLNKRIYSSYLLHLDVLFPSCISGIYSGISYDYYELFYTSEDYENILSL